MGDSPKFQRVVEDERDFSRYIPYSSHITDRVLSTREGDYMLIWKIEGLSFETEDLETIVLRKNQLNTLLRSIASNHVALWQHNIRRKFQDELLGTYDNDFCREFDRKYRATFDDYEMFATELYVTLIYRPHPSKMGKLSAKAGRKSIEELRYEQQQAVAEITKLGRRLESSLRSKYGVQPLEKYDAHIYNGFKGAETVRCSSALEFLNFLLTGIWQRVRVPNGPIYDYLGNGWVHAGAEVIEIRSPARTRYAQGYDFKDYTSTTEPGLLNGLLYTGCEYVLTQSFSCLSKPDGRKVLETQARHLQNTDDGAHSQVEALIAPGGAIDQFENGEFCMGHYHFSLLVYADTVHELQDHASEVAGILGDQGFLAAPLATAVEAAFYAQLPANWTWRPRQASLTSRNFASLACMHNFPTGKRDGNPWGQAISILKTPSRQPYYLNCHYSRMGTNAFGKMFLGNTRLIGMSGGGKTTLMGSMLIWLQKYAAGAPAGTVVFDKDRGLEILINAIGGKYYAFENGRPTGCAPFLLEPTEANIVFCERLVRWAVTRNGETLSTDDEDKISHAVRAVMAKTRENRTFGFSRLIQNMTQGDSREERQNSVLARLKRWTQEGPLGWVFDNETDAIDLTTHRNYGFDGTMFLDNEEIRGGLSMYLLHRLDEMINGCRFSYFMDEAWKWVGSTNPEPAIVEFVGDKQVTIRKLNGFGVFATQMPSSLLKSAVAAQLVQQVATEIYLPNPKASWKEYGPDGFKLTPAEFTIVKELEEESFMFLIKQNNKSTIATLDLRGMDDELAIISGDAVTLDVFHRVVAEVGEDPKDWIPRFHEVRKAEAAQRKLGRTQ